MGDILQSGNTGNDSGSPRWEHWIRPEGIDTLEKLGFWDSTYINDACPSWTHDDLDLQIFVDLPIPYSEVQDTPSEYLRYIITKASLYGEQNAHILSTDDFAEVLDFVSFKVIGVMF